jgi:hypothetical protein
LRLAQVDSALVLRRPIETARIAGHLAFQYSTSAVSAFIGS